MEKVKNMIKQVPWHIYGFHKKCTNELCERPKNDDEKNENVTEWHL